MNKEQIANEYVRINYSNRFIDKEDLQVAFIDGFNTALSQPTADLDKMAQYRKDLELTSNISLEQKPVESDAETLSKLISMLGIPNNTVNESYKLQVLEKFNISVKPPIQTK